MTSKPFNPSLAPETPAGAPAKARYLIHLKTAIPKLAIFLALVFVFEESIYGRLALGQGSYLIAKAWTEGLLYASLLLLIFHKLARGEMWQYRPTFFDFCILAFVCVALLSTQLNNGSILPAMLNVRTMLRYLVIYYVIVLAAWVPARGKMMGLFKILVAVAIVQAFLIILQHFVGDSFRDQYFSPPEVKISTSDFSNIMNVINSKIGAGYGTFGKTALASFFLLFVATIALALAQCRRIKNGIVWWIAYGIILVGIFFSYKRAPLILALMAPILTAWFLGRKTLARRYSFAVLIVAPFAVLLILSVMPDQYVKGKNEEISPVQSFAQLFSKEYWETTTNRSRGWMILEVGRQSLISFKPVGYGADEENAKAILAAQGGEFGKLVGWGAFDDVYVIAALVYYGPLGAGLLIAGFVYIYRRAKLLTGSSDLELRLVGVSLCTVLVLMILAVFVVRLLEFRVFALLLWMFAAIAVSQHRRVLDHQ
jgi:hypothetical protein